MQTTEISFSIKGNLHENDIDLLASELNSFFAGTKRILFKRASNQIDPTCISIATDVISSIAALLYIFIEGVRILKKKPLTYDDLITSVKNMMANKGIANVEVLDIANFRPNASRKFNEPCIMTIQDVRNNSFYKVIVFNEKEIYAIEISPA